MSSAFKIDKGIPLAPSRGGRGSTGIPWREMEVGDSLFVVGRKPETLLATAQAVGRRHSPRRKFATRRVTENGVDGVRIWRVE